MNVKRIPPATLCSWGRARRETKSEPHGKMKLSPQTESIVLGNANAQYGACMLIIAKRRQAVPVATVPITSAGIRTGAYKKDKEKRHRGDK